MNLELLAGRVVEIPVGCGTPEGCFHANKGEFFVDELEPALYMKTTNHLYNTGWVKVTGVTGGARTYYEVETGHPQGQLVPDDPDQPAKCFSISLSTEFRWDVNSQTWV